MALKYIDHSRLSRQPMHAGTVKSSRRRVARYCLGHPWDGDKTIEIVAYGPILILARGKPVQTIEITYSISVLSEHLKENGRDASANRLRIKMLYKC